MITLSFFVRRIVEQTSCSGRNFVLFRNTFVTAVSFLIGFISLGIVVSASSLYLYENKTKIRSKLTQIFSAESKSSSDIDDMFWAKKIMKGGYILHFRHAERDKWIDVQMYDALESDVHKNGLDESRYAENDYFARAVCLNDRGKIQAKAMGEHLSHIKFPIGYVASSVSCRARQTADITFGGFDSSHRLLVHDGPYNESKDRLNSLKEFYKNLPVKNGENTIVSAHASVIRCEMFANLDCDDSKPAEGGFYVLSIRDGELYFEHKFHYFRQFQKVFYDR
jgi:phosphohistidine phosphatase SixA